MSDLAARAYILSLMTEDTKKFAIDVDYTLSEEQQLALEWLQSHDWIRLIDVASLVISKGALMRVFKVMPEAEFWLQLYRRERERDG